MKKTLSLILALVMAVALCTPAIASEGNTLTFSDVTKDQWYYDAVMEMTQMGIFSGKTAIVNGVGTFDPNGTMNRAEFIVTVIRYLYDGKNFDGENWYIGSVNKAIEDGIIKSNDFSDYFAPCSREEMAYIVMNAANVKGLNTTMADPSRIPDYSTISTKYRDSARKAYNAGILAGKTAEGHFAPKDTMTRAEGAVVLYRLISIVRNGETSGSGSGTGSDTQKPDQTVQSQDEYFEIKNMNDWMTNGQFVVAPGKQGSTYNVADYVNYMYASLDVKAKYGTGVKYQNKYGADMSRAPITWVEGEEHILPRPGDVVIRKSDGKAITLTATIVYGPDGFLNEILGLGQEVNIWAGALWGYHKIEGYKVFVLPVGDIGCSNTSINAWWDNLAIGGSDPIVGRFKAAALYREYHLTENCEVHESSEWGALRVIIMGVPGEPYTGMLNGKFAYLLN